MSDQALPGDAPAVCTAPAGDPALANAVIHLNNEQPVLADLFEFPSARDVAVICTNLRTPDGKRPIFIDQSESIFVIPLAHIRFIEMPGRALEAGDRPGAQGGPGRSRSTPAAAAEADLEIDEDFLRRIRDA